MSRRPLPAALIALAALLAGCGGQPSSVEEFEGAERQVAQTVENLSDAGRDKDERRICRQILAESVVERLGECERKVDEALKDADSFELDVTGVRIEGSRAVARVESGGEQDEVERLELVRAGGGWRIASLGG